MLDYGRFRVVVEWCGVKMMDELDDVLAVKGFVEDYLMRFYGEKPLLIDWKAVKLRAGTLLCKEGLPEGS